MVNDYVLHMTPEFPKHWHWTFHDVDKNIHTIYNLESQTLMNHADKYGLFSIPSCLLQISPVHHMNEPHSRLITSHGWLPLIRAFKAPEGSQAWNGAFVFSNEKQPASMFYRTSIAPYFHPAQLSHPLTTSCYRSISTLAPSLYLNPSYLDIIRLP